MRKNIVVCTLFCGLAVLLLTSAGCTSRAREEAGQLRQAEEYYRMGTASNRHSDYEESTRYLKQAEELLVESQKSKVESIAARSGELLGLVRFHLGNTSESEMLYEIAQM